MVKLFRIFLDILKKKLKPERTQNSREFSWKLWKKATPGLQGPYRMHCSIHWHILVLVMTQLSVIHLGPNPRSPFPHKSSHDPIINNGWKTESNSCKIYLCDILKKFKQNFEKKTQKTLNLVDLICQKKCPKRPLNYSISIAWLLTPDCVLFGLSTSFASSVAHPACPHVHQ